jgi:hypothetical protein
MSAGAWTMRNSVRPMRVQIERAWIRLSDWGRLRWGRWLVGAAVSFSILAGIGVVAYGNRVALLQFEWRISWLPLVGSFAIYSLALGLAVLAWGLVLNKVGGRVNWGAHARIYCVTNLAKRVPGVLWYVVGRMADYEALGVSKRSVTVGSGLEMGLIVLSGLVVSLLASPLLVTSQLGSPWWLPVGFVAGLAAMHPAVVRWLLRRLGVDISETERLRYADILLWLAIYAAIWFVCGLCLYAVISAIYPVAPSLVPGIIGAWTLSGVVSMIALFIPFGFGLHELALGALLTLFLPLGVAIIATILTRVLMTICDVVWALLLARVVVASSSPLGGDDPVGDEVDAAVSSPSPLGGEGGRGVRLG